MRRVFVVALCSAFSVGPAIAADMRLGGGLYEYVVRGLDSRTEVDSSQIIGATFYTAAVGDTQPPYAMPPPPQRRLPSYALSPPQQRLATIAPSEPSAVHAEIPPQFLRQEVAYNGPERSGVIIIDTPQRYLFLVEPGGRAIRYGIGVGRPGFEWAGVKVVSRKAEWPDWTPPSQMMQRRPDLPPHMVGGLDNPLGARALYLGSSMYRIHGTNEPWSIGQNVSSGCIRMMNDDVIDLYGRVRVGTKVVVI
jgi:lipoprotein-anchoring transpeptidase ErfK/SrfK